MDKNRTFSPTVITSRKAKKDLEHIKARHADIMKNMEQHQIKVKAYKDQKELERHIQLGQMNEIRKIKQEEDLKVRQEQEKNNREAQQKTRDYQIKMAELKLKRKALES